MRRYLAYDLVTNSEIDVIGASPLSSDDHRQPDICIRFATAEIRSDAKSSGPYRWHGDQLLFEAPNVARYLCAGGTEIIVEPVLGADSKWLTGLLVATALPALLWQRGGFVLHAGAVVLPKHNTTIAFAGRSGSGKSTIISQLLQLDAHLIGDDTLNLKSSKGEISVTGLPCAYFTGEPAGSDRIAVAVAGDQTARYAPLAAIIVLERVDALVGPPITRLTGADAVQALLTHRHRPMVPTLLGLDRQVLQFCALLCASTPIYIWKRGQGALQISDVEFSALDRVTKIGNE